MYVPIPKCATNSLRATFPEWRATDEYKHGCPIPGFAIVRDPVERWFSGIAEATFHHDPDRTYHNMLDEARKGRFVWDNHTRPQSEFLTGFNVTLVRLESAAQFILDEFGRELRWERSRRWEPAADLIPAIKEFYAADCLLYDSAA